MLKRAFGCLALLLHAGPLAAAETGIVSAWVEGYNSKIRLIAARGVPGVGPERAVAGIEIVMTPEWKTYWRMPGDAGVPPQFDLAKSDNVRAARVLYPAPHRYTDKAGDAVGYKTAVLFPIEFEAVDPSKPATLRLTAEFGVCLDICIPAEATLELVIAPGAGDNVKTAAQLAAALARVPRGAGQALVTDPLVERTLDERAGKPPRLVIETKARSGTTGADLFLEAPDGLYLPLPRKVSEAADGRVRFEVDLSRGIDLADFKGKALRLTVVSDAGASEALWQLE